MASQTPHCTVHHTNAYNDTRQKEKSVMILSRHSALVGIALVGLLTLSPARVDRAVYAASPAGGVAATACAFALPSSPTLRVLSGASGVGDIVHLSSGAYAFILARFGGINASVHQALGVTPPAGDALATFSFTLPGGHSYLGLVNVVQHGTQAQVCLRGVAYRDLTNAFDANRTPPVAVVLEGTIGTTFARVDLRVGTMHYYVYGRPRIL